MAWTQRHDPLPSDCKARRRQTATRAGWRCEAPPEMGARCPEAETDKKYYNQRLSDCIAFAISAELRDRGMSGSRPTAPGQAGASGAECRLAGGIGSKKVDVSWATEESGLIFAVSVK